MRRGPERGGGERGEALAGHRCAPTATTACHRVPDPHPELPRPRSEFYRDGPTTVPRRRSTGPGFWSGAELLCALPARSSGNRADDLPAGASVSVGSWPGFAPARPGPIAASFLPRVRLLLASVGVLHVDETLRPRRRPARIRAHRGHRVPDGLQAGGRSRPPSTPGVPATTTSTRPSWPFCGTATAARSPPGSSTTATVRTPGPRRPHPRPALPRPRHLPPGRTRLARDQDPATYLRRMLAHPDRGWSTSPSSNPGCPPSKCGLESIDVLTRLFTTGAWLPPQLPLLISYFDLK